MGVLVIKYGSYTLSYAGGLDASPLCSAISMAHLVPRFPANGEGTLASPQLVPRSALREESREADRLQLCLNAMETVLFALEREMATAEAAAIEAQARLASKALAMILLFHFMRCHVLSCRVFLSPF